MPKHDMRYYAIPADDDYDYERVGHFINGHAPKNAREIDETEARRIAQAIDARAVASPQAVAADPPVAVDLTQIHNRLEAHSKMLVEQAHALDSHETKIDATQASVAEYLQGVKAGKSA